MSLKCCRKSRVLSEIFASKHQVDRKKNIFSTSASCKDPKTGKSLNSITAKGPNMLSYPYRILLRFRNRKYAISTDVTKAYHGLRTGDIEMHLRRVIYRCKSTDEWKTYGFLCVSFGDVAAQAILECCLKRLAKTYKQDDIKAALMLTIDCFYSILFLLSFSLSL